MTEIKRKVYLHFPLEKQRTISSRYNIKEVILISRFIDATSKYRAEFPFSSYSRMSMPLILSTQKKLHELASNSHLRATYLEAD